MCSTTLSNLHATVSRLGRQQFRHGQLNDLLLSLSNRVAIAQQLNNVVDTFRDR